MDPILDNIKYQISVDKTKVISYCFYRFYQKIYDLSDL